MIAPAFPPVRAVFPYFDKSTWSNIPDWNKGRHAEVDLFFANQHDRERVQAVLQKNGFNVTIKKALPQRGNRDALRLSEKLPQDEEGNKWGLTVSRHLPQMDHHELYKLLVDETLMDPKLLPQCGINYQAPVLRR